MQFMLLIHFLQLKSYGFTIHKIYSKEQLVLIHSHGAFDLEALAARNNEKSLELTSLAKADVLQARSQAKEFDMLSLGELYTNSEDLSDSR